MTTTKSVSLRFLTGPYIGTVITTRIPSTMPNGRCIRHLPTGALALIGSPTLKGVK